MEYIHKRKWNNILDNLYSSMLYFQKYEIHFQLWQIIWVTSKCIQIFQSQPNLQIPYQKVVLPIENPRQIRFSIIDAYVVFVCETNLTTIRL